MVVIGIRCSNNDFVLAILEGTRKDPDLVATHTATCPAGYPDGLRLAWLLQEAEEILSKYKPDSIVVKSAEAAARKNQAFVERIELEAVFLLAAGKSGIKNASRKVKATIAKNLGLKGKASYLSTKLDVTPISSFGDYDEKTREAILAAWSDLPL